jgi:hypothetical protein
MLPSFINRGFIPLSLPSHEQRDCCAFWQKHAFRRKGAQNGTFLLIHFAEMNLMSLSDQLFAFVIISHDSRKRTEKPHPKTTVLHHEKPVCSSHLPFYVRPHQMLDTCHRSQQLVLAPVTMPYPDKKELVSWRGIAQNLEVLLPIWLCVTFYILQKWIMSF